MIGRLWRLARQPISRRRLFQGAAALLASGFAGKWLMDEFSSPDAATSAPGNVPPSGPGFIDVREFKKTMTVEELNRTAEAYFARVKSWDFHHALPLWHPSGAPNQLNNFAHVLHGLQLLPGMTVVDFGAGSCWATRWLTQMGMQAIALDVSETALKIGQALYERLPVIGDRPKPAFLLFDGHRIDLPDASVDRILCLDTFHHLLNPDEVLREMSRILKPGGIAGFSEPGPNHSRSFASQFEMRNFRVLEDDVDIHRIWSSARQAGFARIRLAILSAPTYTVGFSEFEDYLQGGTASETFANATRAEMLGRRVFFLQKTAQPPTFDSRGRTGLAAKLQVDIAPATVKEGAPLTARVVVTNSGIATWLPHRHGSRSGTVWLGGHLLDASGRMLALGFFRHPLTADARPIAPGETVTLDVQIPAPSRGSYILELDVVSEDVAWFGTLGSHPVQTKIQVI